MCGQFIPSHLYIPITIYLQRSFSRNDSSCFGTSFYSFVLFFCVLHVVVIVFPYVKLHATKNLEIVKIVDWEKTQISSVVRFILNNFCFQFPVYSILSWALNCRILISRDEPIHDTWIKNIILNIKKKKKMNFFQFFIISITNFIHSPF